MEPKEGQDFRKNSVVSSAQNSSRVKGNKHMVPLPSLLEEHVRDFVKNSFSGAQGLKAEVEELEWNWRREASETDCKQLSQRA